ncbi:hypothetical protein D3C78_1894410 [compost metagenome]
MPTPQRPHGAGLEKVSHVVAVDLNQGKGIGGGRGLERIVVEVGDDLLWRDVFIAMEETTGVAVIIM